MHFFFCNSQPFLSASLQWIQGHSVQFRVKAFVLQLVTAATLTGNCLGPQRTTHPRLHRSEEPAAHDWMQQEGQPEFISIHEAHQLPSSYWVSWGCGPLHYRPTCPSALSCFPTASPAHLTPSTPLHTVYFWVHLQRVQWGCSFTAPCLTFCGHSQLNLP